MIKKLSALILALAVLSTVSLSVFAEEIPTVTPVDISACVITLEKGDLVYSGTAKKPTIKVEKDSVVYKEKVDYTVSYKNNINAGVATAIISAVENSTVLTGSVEKTFDIEKKDINSFKTKTLSQTEFVYDNKACVPRFTLSETDLSAKLNKDFTVTYKGNFKIGIATATAKGIGNYSGTVTKEFKIRPNVVKNLTVSQLKDETFRLSWTRVSGNVDGYRLYRYNDSKKDYVLAATTKNNYYDISGREAATTYTYMVKAYTKVGKTYLLNDPSAAKKVTMRPEKAVIVPSYYKGKNFVFKWEKISADGFEIKYSKNKNMKKGVKVVKVNSKKATSKKVKVSSKKQYYYKVRAFVYSNGTKLYGSWSDKKTTQFSNVYSSFSTTFYSPAGRTTNIKKACSFINGTVLRPNDVFSFNKIVGRRTPERGFKKATIYSGQSVDVGYGGGVCQVSTTIFNAALLGNLTINERYQHSMKVHYVVPGRDAAISWGTNDLKFKNSTNTDIKISAKVYNNSKIEIKLLTNSSAKHKKVTLNVKQSGDNYTLTRSVGKKVNYTTRSKY